MTKDMAIPQSELNVYVSSRNGPRAKETTFREWVVNNQIGMEVNILPNGAISATPP
jgi:acyl-CoA-dependent ceramide synthase